MTLGKLRELAENLTTTDAVSQQVALTRAAIEVLTTVDTSAAGSSLSRLITETLTTDDAASRSLLSSRAVSELLTTVDSLGSITVLIPRPLGGKAHTDKGLHGGADTPHEGHGHAHEDRGLSGNASLTVGADGGATVGGGG